MNIQTPVIIAGFGHAVSKTRLSCAARGNLVNLLALAFVKQQASCALVFSKEDFAASVIKFGVGKNE